MNHEAHCVGSVKYFTHAGGYKHTRRALNSHIAPEEVAGVINGGPFKERNLPPA